MMAIHFVRPGNAAMIFGFVPQRQHLVLHGAMG